MKILAIGLTVWVLLAGVCQIRAGEKVRVGASVAAGQQVSIDRIPHQLLDGLLSKYVDAQGNVNYSAWKKNVADRKSLDRYLATLSYADPSKPAKREARLAFWINAYNAVTLKGILREYPTTSIRNHTAKLFGYNIWHDLLLRVGSEEHSLDHMEHKILRPMGEPRIHFAIVCASASCPRLLNQAYTPDKLESQLSLNTKAFFADTRNFRHVGSQFQMSSILSWFAEDFGKNKAAQLRTIAPYLPSGAQEAAKNNSVDVSYLDYDWGLNDQKTAGR